MSLFRAALIWRIDPGGDGRRGWFGRLVDGVDLSEAGAIFPFCFRVIFKSHAWRRTIAAGGAWTLAFGPANHAASFDCSKADKPIERAIQR
jgi:hypothetical protein